MTGVLFQLGGLGVVVWSKLRPTPADPLFLTRRNSLPARRLAAPARLLGPHPQHGHPRRLDGDGRPRARGPRRGHGARQRLQLRARADLLHRRRVTRSPSSGPGWWRPRARASRCSSPRRATASGSSSRATACAAAAAGSAALAPTTGSSWSWGSVRLAAAAPQLGAQRGQRARTAAAAAPWPRAPPRQAEALARGPRRAAAAVAHRRADRRPRRRVRLLLVPRAGRRRR